MKENKITIERIFFDIGLNLLIFALIIGFTVFNAATLLFNMILFVIQLLLCMAFIIDMPFLGKKIELYLINKGVFKENKKENDII